MKLSSLAKNLVGSWNLDEQSFNPSSKRFTDKSAYSNHGTGQGTQLGSASPGFQADRMGQLARAAPFNGTDDCVRIPDSASLSPTSAMTAMCWVKGAAQNGKSILTHIDSGINQRSFMITSSNISPYNNMRVYISDDGTSTVGHIKDYKSSIPAFDNTWHLIGFSFDAGTLKLFVDGVEDINPIKSLDDAITAIHDSTADIMLGCRLSNDVLIVFFTGDLARAKMWNRALTDAEWLLAYEQYNSGVII